MHRRFVALAAIGLALVACTTQEAPARELSVARGHLLADTDSVALSASSLASAAGESVSFTAKAPVTGGAGLVDQAIDGSWDAHFQLDGPPKLPDGWALQYFAGAQQLPAAPTTPAGWAGVTRVRANGELASDGSLGGVPYVIGSASVATAAVGGTFSGGATGFGWNVFFSTDRSRVYNVHHRDASATVMCRKLSDGSPCSEGWPFPVYHTSDRATGWVDPRTQHLWHETFDTRGRGGWECIDTSGESPVQCATRFVAAFEEASSFNHHIDLQNIGRELYSMDTRHGALTCLDLDANAGAGGPCAGQPYAGYGGTDIARSGIRAIAGKLYVLADSQITCFDPQTKAACAGMSWPQPGDHQPILPVPSGDGIVRNLCTKSTCYTLIGGSSTLPSPFFDYLTSLNSDPNEPNPSSCCGQSLIGEDSVGSKVFLPLHRFNDATLQWDDAFDCFDLATRARCPGFPVNVPRVYSAVVDPSNANCLWTNAADGVIRAWQISTGRAGCAAPPFTAFRPAPVVPRLACSGASLVSAWSSFTLTAPAPDSYSSARLTVRNTSGVAITGWTNIAINGQSAIDLSSLTVSTTGPAPSFEVSYSDLTDSGTATASFRVLGQAPELCWSASARATCPSGPGLLPSPLPATAVSAVTASGTRGGSALTPTTLELTVPGEQAAALCGATLAGALRGPGDAPIAGARVALLGENSEPILDGQQRPLQTHSDPTGSYKFPRLLIGNYRVRVSSVRDHWTVSSATVTRGGQGTTDAVSGSVTSNVITLTADLAGAVDAAFAGPVDDDGDGIANYVEKGPSLDTPRDADGDGIADYLDLDSDNDGILDTTERGSSERPRDSDEDELPDYLDTDSDGDSIADAYEATSGKHVLREDGSLGGAIDAVNGIPQAVLDEPGSSTLNYQLQDRNSDGRPDYLSADSDGDQIPDTTERGQQGLPVDTDGDTTPDYLDLDSDADELSDALESNNTGELVDTDADGTPDRLDTDSDADRLPDKAETARDPDGDNLGNWRDADSDGDGIGDELEGAADPDGDAVPSCLDLDSDGDTIPDAVEQGAAQERIDSDQDAIPDFLDRDSDEDGIPDEVEAGENAEYPRDSDSDGKPDYLDSDSDGDELPDELERGANVVDTDADGTADYRDVDSDDDGVSDSYEAGPLKTAPRDTDSDGTPDYRDPDSDDDGIADAAERGSDTQPVDTDADGTPDLVDTDSDDDGIRDPLEGADDLDRDNLGNWRDLDSDGDGLADSLETDADTDGDETPNFFDLDSDGDGVRDQQESARDSDGDALPDFLDLDSDNDCLPDAQEASAGLLSATLPSPRASDNCTEPDNDRCDTTRGLCTHGCTTDTDCVDASICDAVTRACAPGCRPGGNQCSGSEVCTAAGSCLVDTDGDGIPDEVERERGLRPNAADSDGDSLSDAIEAPGGTLVDTDRDGKPDALDTDADGDGIADRIEVGPDPKRPRDADADDLPDWRDLDSDADGWPDAVEKATDTDEDGTPDCLDLDSDGDGVSDANELAWGLSRADADSDDDAIRDGVEAGPGPGVIDSDADGRPDAIDIDSDNDALPDALERGDGDAPADSDGDELPDYRDLDSDDDRIPDAIEARDDRGEYADTDADGVYDYRDSDADDDGLRDDGEGQADFDGDRIGAWRDLDADNDCASDQAEGAQGTQLNAAEPSALPSDNCPAEAPICDMRSGSCVTVDRTPPRACTAENASSVCLSGACDEAAGQCLPVGCSNDAACGVGMYCDRSTQTCAEQLEEGAQLLADEIHGAECNSELAAQMCASGACNRYTNRCAAKDGETCVTPADCASNACLDRVCVSENSVPTVTRLSGGCSTSPASGLDLSWLFLGCALRLRRRKSSP
jgi:hypothetical protein